MTVKELIKQLLELENQDSQVYISVDEEGNEYKKIYELVITNEINEEEGLEDCDLDIIKAGSILIYPN